MRHRLPRRRDVRLAVDLMLMANLITMQALMILAVFTSSEVGAHLLGLTAVIAGAALGTAVVQAWPRATAACLCPSAEDVDTMAVVPYREWA
jgi:hypothetical protein